MKRTVIFTAMVLMISAGTAVVGGPEPGEGEMGITSSGSSASSSTAVGPNGTEWSASVEMRGTNSNITAGETVNNVSYSANKTTFSGNIQASTPCHVVDQEVEQKDSQSYVMNVKTVKQDLDGEGVCVQQAVMIGYDASFEAETPYTLEIKHDNETVKTLENEDTGEETKEGKGFFSGFVGWLSSLF